MRRPSYKQPMFKVGMMWLMVGLAGLVSPLAFLIGACVIVGLDLALPWGER